MLPLDSSELHLWTACLPLGDKLNFDSNLSCAERDHADRFHFAKDRALYVFAHAVLRDILSRYLPCSPGEIQFEVDAFGRPFLARSLTTQTLQFNLSHSGRLIRSEEHTSELQS